MHVIYRFDVGGMETLLAECIRRIPRQRYRHAVVCISGYSDFLEKIEGTGTPVYSLDKPAGLGLSAHVRLWKLLRTLRPTILHTYCISAVEYTATGLLAGVPVRLHSEHGRNLNEADGRNLKYNVLRRVMALLMHSCVAVSNDLQNWLAEIVRLPRSKISCISNGVDTDRFSPDSMPLQSGTARASQSKRFVIGTVGRVSEVKNHSALVDAFVLLLERGRDNGPELSLAIIGDGPLLPPLKRKISALGIAHLVWTPGSRNDIAEILKTFSVFVLSSISEAMPVAALEAMATGVPVIAPRVGGLPDIVKENITGMLVDSPGPEHLAMAIAEYVQNPGLGKFHGEAGRRFAQQHHGIDRMVNEYLALYDARCK
ncbi:TIGR03088 family PEP-CTERM/XrtA system glycosyltransferase [Massilia sp. UMI-21]|nr:TIGR03088 family PEP-CTERM/XrtA system glycosyltransferase [Massilia sp. UMI-21]